MAISKLEKLKRATYAQKVLASLYPNPEAPLHHEDAFTLLVAVMLSAQTTDAMVNQVTPSLFKVANTPEKMAALSSAEILTHIRRCNYSPTKSRNLKKLSERLVEDFGGKVPKTFEELETLPGIGHKTASVVMGQMFKLPAFPVDTHIHRLAVRWKLTRGKNVEETEADLKKLFPESTWHDVHLQMIFYGREFCGARSCDGLTCRVCKHLNLST
jgi:endonuclease-3